MDSLLANTELAYQICLREFLPNWRLFEMCVSLGSIFYIFIPDDSNFTVIGKKSIKALLAE